MKTGSEIRREILFLGDDYTEAESIVLENLTEAEIVEYNIYMMRICKIY